MNRLNYSSIVLLFIVFVFYAPICCGSNNKRTYSNVQQFNEKSFEFINSDNIKTVRLEKLGVEFSEPAIELGSGEKLLISFDDISEEPGSYSYSLTHCDSQWNPSDLFPTDYINGFEVNEVKDFINSTGTVIPYVHFRIEIPNDEVHIKISGNYCLKIFSTYEPEKILIQKQFVVYESLVAVSANIRQPSVGEQRYSGQQLELKLDTKGIRVNDPYSDIKVQIYQNHLFGNSLNEVSPVFVNGSELDYTKPDALIFAGVNEFRFFDIRNTRFLSQGLQSVDYITGAFHVQLKPDESRRKQKYSQYSDFNGKYNISFENSDQSHIEADYLWTYFSLLSPFQLDEGKSVYILGEITGWQLNPESKMDYSYERGAFEKRLQLKQGVYNYSYVVADDSTGEVDYTHFEGSHFDTENSYFILVYFRPTGSRYERVVGYKKINSRNPF